MKQKQLELEIGLDFKPITLPDTHLDLVEQFAFALQNRDAIGMGQLIDDADVHKKWGNKEGFIRKFLGFCKQMEEKHQGVYVHTVPGQCGRESCNSGTSGLGVTVSTIKNNKLLWRFNLVFIQTKRDTLSLWLCRQFEVKNEQIPF